MPAICFANFNSHLQRICFLEEQAIKSHACVVGSTKARGHLSIIRSALNSIPKNFDADGIYKSQITYKNEDNYYRDRYYVKLNMTKDSVIGSIWVETQQSETQNFSSTMKSGSGWTVKVQQASNGGWNLSSYSYRGGLQTDMSATSDYYKTFGEYSATADSNREFAK